MQHVTKVFLCTDALLLEDRDGTGPGSRPTTWRFKAGVGVEEVDFNPCVKLEGKVEIYLQTVLDAQRNSLRKALESSIMRLTKQTRTEWLMDKFKDGRGTDPAQLTLLVTGMEYVKLVGEWSWRPVSLANVLCACGYTVLSISACGGEKNCRVFACAETALDGMAHNPKSLEKALERSVADLSDLIRLTQTNLSKSDRTKVMCMM
jgi:hypothetical protein